MNKKTNKTMELLPRKKLWSADIHCALCRMNISSIAADLHWLYGLGRRSLPLYNILLKINNSLQKSDSLQIQKLSRLFEFIVLWSIFVRSYWTRAIRYFFYNGHLDIFWSSHDKFETNFGHLWSRDKDLPLMWFDALVFSKFSLMQQGAVLTSHSSSLPSWSLIIHL